MTDEVNPTIDPSNALSGLPFSTMAPPAISTPAQEQLPSAPSVTNVEPSSMQPTVQPHVSLARHIVDALGGGSAKPGDWARSIIGGALSSMADVGDIKVPAGGGALEGIGQAAANRDKRLKLAAQQRFENQEKLKQDQREEQELQDKLKSSAVQRSYQSALTMASIQTRQQEAARFPLLQQEDREKLQQLHTANQEVEVNQRAILSAAGVDITQLPLHTSYDSVGKSDAQALAKGDSFLIANGEQHKAGEDQVGAYVVPGSVWDEKITKPVDIIKGYTPDKKGNLVPNRITAVPGTRVGDLLAIAQGAKADLEQKQKMITDAADLRLKQAQAENQRAEAQEHRANAIEPLAVRVAKQTEALKQGSPEAAGALLVNGDLTLSEMKTRGMTPDFIVKSVNAAKALDGTYNPQVAEAQFTAAKSPTNVQFFGSAKSLTDPGGTLDQLQAQWNKLPSDFHFPVFNKLADAITFAAGGSSQAGFIQTALGVADDYAKVMGGGEGSDTSRLQVLNSFLAQYNKGQMGAAIQAARDAVASQEKSRIGKNKVMQRMYGSVESPAATQQGGFWSNIPGAVPHPH